MAETPYTRAARQKYRYAVVKGDGPHGVVSFCFVEKRVGLFQSAADAQRVAAGRCSAVPCKGDHRLEPFEPEYAPQYVLDSPAERFA